MAYRSPGAGRLSGKPVASREVRATNGATVLERRRFDPRCHRFERRRRHMDPYSRQIELYRGRIEHRAPEPTSDATGLTSATAR